MIIFIGVSTKPGYDRDNPIFIDTRVVAAYKRHKNLRDLLVRGRFGNAEEEQDPEVLLDLALEYINKNP